MRNRIVFDLDDTLIDFMNPFISWHNNLYGTNLKKEDFISYNFWDIIGCSIDEAKVRVGLFMDGNSNFKPIPYAQSLIKTLSRENDLYIVSARDLIDFERTQRTVEEHFKGYFKDIILTNGFSNPLAKGKDVICKELGSKTIIEDNFNNALKCARTGMLSYLINQPWNEKLECYHIGVRRVSSLDIIEERERFKKPVLQ